MHCIFKFVPINKVISMILVCDSVLHICMAKFDQTEMGMKSFSTFTQEIKVSMGMKQEIL